MPGSGQYDKRSVKHATLTTKTVRPAIGICNDPVFHDTTANQCTVETHTIVLSDQHAKPEICKQELWHTVDIMTTGGGILTTQSLVELDYYRRSYRRSYRRTGVTTDLETSTGILLLQFGALYELQQLVVVTMRNTSTQLGHNFIPLSSHQKLGFAIENYGCQLHVSKKNGWQWLQDIWSLFAAYHCLQRDYMFFVVANLLSTTIDWHWLHNKVRIFHVHHLNGSFIQFLLPSVNKADC